MTVAAVAALCLAVCAFTAKAQTVLDWGGLTNQRALQTGDVSSHLPRPCGCLGCSTSLLYCPWISCPVVIWLLTRWPYFMCTAASMQLSGAVHAGYFLWIGAG